jgi:DNA-binding PadR family transcriptional regulator
MSATTPLREPTFLILTALAAKPQHGYGILRDVEEISEGRVSLQAGTLYAALDRLSSDGWVDVDREEVVDGRLRRYYRLTEPGAARLAVEVEKLTAHTRAARQRLRTRLTGGTA